MNGFDHHYPEIDGTYSPHNLETWGHIGEQLCSGFCSFASWKWSIGTQPHTCRHRYVIFGRLWHLAVNWKHGAGKQHLSGPGGDPTRLVEMSLFLTSYDKMDFTPHPLHWSHDLLNRTFAKGYAFDWILRFSTSFLSAKSKPNYNSLFSLVFLATRERLLACELRRYAAPAPRDKSKGDQGPIR